MKTAGRVHDHDVLSATDARVDSIECHRCGVRAGLSADEVGSGAR